VHCATRPGDQFLHGEGPRLVAIAEDETVGIHGADGVAHHAADLGVRGVVHAGGLVEEVEGDFAVGEPLYRPAKRAQCLAQARRAAWEAHRLSLSTGGLMQ
jgi:hypothetical protein